MTNSYKIRFVSLSGTPFEIHIYPTATGYDSNAAVELAGAESPIVTEEEDSEDILCPLRPSTGYINFIDHTEDCHLMHEMTPTTGDEISVDLYCTSTDTYYWRGYVQQQAFNQSWDVAPMEISLPIISRLGMMSESTLPNEAQGLKSVGQILETICGDTLTEVYLPKNEFGISTNLSPIDLQVMFNIDIFKSEISITNLTPTISNETPENYECETYGDVLESICNFFGWAMYEWRGKLIVRDHKFTIADSHDYRLYSVDDLTEEQYYGNEEIVTIDTEALEKANFNTADNEISGIAPTKTINMKYGDGDWNDEMFNSSQTSRIFLTYQTYSHNMAVGVFDCWFRYTCPGTTSEITQYVYNKSGVQQTTLVGHESMILRNYKMQEANWWGGEITHGSLRVIKNSTSEYDYRTEEFTSIILGRCTSDLNAERKGLVVGAKCPHLLTRTATKLSTETENKYNLFLCLSGSVRYMDNWSDWDFVDKDNDESKEFRLRLSIKIGNKYLDTAGNLQTAEVIHSVRLKDGSFINYNEYDLFTDGMYVLPLNFGNPGSVLGKVEVALYTPSLSYSVSQYIKIDNFSISFRYYNTDLANAFLSPKTDKEYSRVINSKADGDVSIKTKLGLPGNAGMLFSSGTYNSVEQMYLWALGQYTNPVEDALSRMFNLAKDILKKERIMLKVGMREEAYGLEDYSYGDDTYRVLNTSRNWRDEETKVTLVKMN